MSIREKMLRVMGVDIHCAAGLCTVDVQLLVDLEHEDRVQDVKGQKVRSCSAFKRFCLERHGFFGKGCCVQLLVGLWRANRAIWPDPSGHCVGFKDST